MSNLILVKEHSKAPMIIYHCCMHFTQPTDRAETHSDGRNAVLPRGQRALWVCSLHPLLKDFQIPCWRNLTPVLEFVCCVAPHGELFPSAAVGRRHREVGREGKELLGPEQRQEGPVCRAAERSPSTPTWQPMLAARKLLSPSDEVCARSRAQTLVRELMFLPEPWACLSLHSANSLVSNSHGQLYPWQTGEEWLSSVGEHGVPTTAAPLRRSSHAFRCLGVPAEPAFPWTSWHPNPTQR